MKIKGYDIKTGVELWEKCAALEAENERLRFLLKSSLRHCETERDDTLVTMMHDALRGYGLGHRRGDER